ncbi:MAG: nuclease [Acidobacteriaceae bacterium]
MSQKLLTLVALVTFALTMNAQQPAQKAMGSIATADASVSGGLEVSGPRARLISNASITANDRTAQIDLDRGGLVQVCATSAFHLLRSGTGDALLFALDRGAMEIRTASRAQDAILTPDLRFTMLTAGPLDLRMRVTREGDTCVENRGDTAPVLQIRESFGDATYHLAPGQHVLFEHGSLHEVVDRERSDCGCPAATPAMIAASAPNATSVVTPQQVAALNPFPAAQSADLSPTPPVIPVVPSARNAASATLNYDGPASAPPSQPVKPASPPMQRTPAIVAALPVASVPPLMPPGAHDIFHAIGHFFHRLFHGHAQASSASR